jgi:hypothetical protein
MQEPTDSLGALSRSRPGSGIAALNSPLLKSSCNTTNNPNIQRRLCTRGEAMAPERWLMPPHTRPQLKLGAFNVIACREIEAKDFASTLPRRCS